MKNLFPIATMLTALTVAGVAVMNFPVGQSHHYATIGLTRAPQVAVSPIGGLIRDRLGSGRILSQ